MRNKAKATTLRGTRILSTTAKACLALVPVLVVASWLDHRQIVGLDPWVKPLKFALSIAIYLATIGVFVRLLDRPRWTKLVAWTVSVSMAIEMLCISFQALRGVQSHFNTASALDSQIYALMKWAVVANTVAIVLLLIAFASRSIAIATGTLWGIRTGLALFVIGSLEGIVMAVRGAHAVGIADGGPGLPIIDWSTVGGDLRIAHFFGIHALQVLPLVGLAIDAVGRRRRWSRVRRQVLSCLVAIGYALALGFLFTTAMNGMTLFRW